MARAFIRARRGSIAIQLALLLTVVLGFVALGTEFTFLMFKQRQMQAAGDAAALGAAQALASGVPQDFTLESRAIAASAGFVHGVAGVTVDVNRPPILGRYAGSNDAVEVVIKQPQFLAMASLFRDGLFEVGARAVATVGSSGSYCILQLDTSSGATGVSLSNGATVNLTQCGMAVDATGSRALSVTGGAILNVQSVAISGMAYLSNGGTINASKGVKSGQPYVADPYASVVRPSFSGCKFTGKSYGHSNSGRQYISPGVYCNGLKFTDDAIVTMNPGVYIINQGTFDVGGAVQLSGSDVTIVLTSNSGSSYAKAVISNGAVVNLSAPGSGALAGLLFFGDRGASISDRSDFTGGSSLNLTGALYFPSQSVRFSNGVSNTSTCTQLVAGRIEFTGGARFNNSCAGSGVASIGGVDSLLSE